jgi:hypothetical protein
MRLDIERGFKAMSQDNASMKGSRSLIGERVNSIDDKVTDLISSSKTAKPNP